MQKNLNLLAIQAFLSCLACLANFSVYAQERKIEESLYYSDPTVLHDDEWSGGIFIDALRVTSLISTYDTNGNEHTGHSTDTKLGFSGYYGKGNLSVLFSYHPDTGTISVPTGSTTTIVNTKTDIYEINLRYLDKAHSSWFVPYYLAGILYARNDWVIPTVVQNGVTEDNTAHAHMTEIGAGAIIPVSDKYGFRVDARIGVGPIKTTSNLFAQFNSSSTGHYSRPTATMYYNITDSTNVQLGVQRDSIMNGTGAFLQLGTKF
jgi:hypothetical protein